ncbi:MAG: TolC family outer membrane protein [Rhodospirillales bacterium]|nr:TolC family outer membrane protein [Rhodospirillales bacterium]
MATELQGLVTSNPEILAREKEVEAASDGIDEAYAGYLPRLDVLGAYGPQYIKSPLAAQEDGGTWTSQAQVLSGQLKQNLFDGFATPANVRGARLNVEVATATLAGTRQNVIFAGIDAYIEALRQNQLIALARESEQTIMRQLNLEDERVQRGVGIAVDVLQAKSRLQVAKERRVAFEGAFADAVSQYIRVFDHPPDVSEMRAPEVPAGLLPQDLGEAVEIARESNPAIDSSLATVEVASERRRAARADYYPRLDLVGSANRENDNNLVRGTSVDMSVVLQATWNLFNGFATTANVSQAINDYQASLRNHEVVAREVVEQTRLSWNEMTTAKARTELLNNAVAIASEVFDARSKLREAGRETVVNVLDAENEVYNARINLVIAESDGIRAGFQVLQAIGRLELRDLGIDG